MNTVTFSRLAKAAVPALAALALAACGQQEEKTYEADAEDMSGGELIVTEQDPAAVEVDIPETEMTMVPGGEVEAQESEAPEAEVPPAG